MNLLEYSDKHYSKYLIYALVDPRNNEIRYIGQSRTGLKRPKSHAMPYAIKNDKNKSHKRSWIKNMEEAGVAYKILVLKNFDTFEPLNEWERIYIEMYKNLGAPLTNHHRGGAWTIEDCKRSIPEEVRLKISNSLKGRVVSKETRLRRSRSTKGIKVIPPHTRDLIAKARGSKKFVCEETGKEYYSISMASNDTKISRHLINRSLHGKRKSTGGYTFRFVEANNVA